MEMETSSSIHDSKSMVHDNDDGSGTGPFDPGNSPGASFMEASLNSRSDGKMQRDINGSENTRGSIETSISPTVDPDSITQHEDDNVNVDEYVKVQGGNDQQQSSLTPKSGRIIRGRVTRNSTSKLQMDGDGSNFMASLHDPNGFAIDPDLGTPASTQGDPRILSHTSSPINYQKGQNNGYEQRSQEQSDEAAAAAAAAALSATAQVDYFRQQAQSQMQQTNHAAQLQLQAQVQLQRQRQLQQLQQQTTPNQRTQLQHAQQQAAFLSKQSHNFHMQQQQAHQLQQSMSTEEEELFARHMSPTSAQTPEGTVRDRSLRHSHAASPYSGMEMMANAQYTPTGHLSGQLSQFSDPMVVATLGMDFSLRHQSPMSSQMTMIPPPLPSSNGGTPGPSSSGRKRKASSIGSNQGDSDAITELKDLAKSNMTNSLVDLAVRVREEEKGFFSEKFRQVFAMTWLKKNCEVSPDAAVPRNRIYARYVELCAEYSLKALNPASFGKLVRVAYPGIKTRRLGVRGQSKYHYCGFRLIGEQNNPTGNTPTGTPGRFGNSPDISIKGQFDGQLGFPSQSPHSTPSQVRFRSSSTPVSEFDSKLSREGLDEFTQVGGSELGSVPDLRFHNAFSDFADISLSSTAHESFSIPRLDKYLTSEVDPDFATTLYSLYLSHCRSLVESLRFMHIKKFLNFMGTFVGGLTAPIQKLLSKEDVATWIAQADWAMYKVRYCGVDKAKLTF